VTDLPGEPTRSELGIAPPEVEAEQTDAGWDES
jgi:hypothetical protein